MLQYNDTIKKFLKEQNIDYSYIENNENAICYNKKDINSIISKYGMYQNKKRKKVCIDDIIGKDRGKSQNLLLQLNDLFNEKEGNYKKRSLSMLKYSSNEIVEKLKSSFEKEPIELKEIKQGKYVVGNDGMHRVNLLRVHYINERKKCEDNEEIKRLKDRYTIDVVVEELDNVKTYSRYLISLYSQDITVEDEINEEYLKTENVILYNEKNEYKKFNQKQLVEYVKERIIESLKNEDLEKVLKIADSDKYFKEYLKNIKFTKLVK